jgi:DcaP outer membrane protein
MLTGTRFMAAVLILSAVCANAAQLEQTRSAAKVDTSPQVPTMDMSEVIALLRQQQQDLAQQRKLLQHQSQQIAGLKRELDVLRAPSPQSMTREAIASSETPTQALPPQTMEKDSEPEKPKTQAQLQTAADNSVAKAQTDDPTRDMLSDFKGAWRLPGTSAALAIGGYVKTSMVYNFDPLDIKDRFIVGSIPVSQTNSTTEAQSSLTASQSRLNFDLREPTNVGLLRAFIEGDFAGDGDTFRLRHAFGQWNRVLAGKTWSAFVDTEASPEEVDFEGLNGRVNVRQTQVRFMPRLGKDYEFQFSLEDPNPQIQNGTGVSRAPDVVASGRFQPHSRLHVKLGLIGRQIRAQQAATEGSGVEKKYAYGVTLSGRFETPLFNKRDSLLFQLNGGNGIGRYVNDLSSVGSYDGIFNPNNGKLELFDITAGYVSLQHWWGGTRNLRSNFIVGVVNVDNPGFVDGEAYKRTLRASTNLFWTPTPRIDIGAEYLWGNRKNENGQNADATQIQLAARYRF